MKQLLLLPIFLTSSALLCYSQPANSPSANGATADYSVLANLPTVCNNGQFWVVSNATSGQNWYTCIGNVWVQQSSSGVAFQGSPTAGAPVVAVSSLLITSVTPATACTSAFTGLAPAICAVSMFSQSTTTSDNLQCGGGICPAGLYEIVAYYTISAGFSNTCDVTVSYTSPAGAQSYDEGQLAIGGEESVGQILPAMIQSTGVANFSYTMTPVGLCTGTIVLKRDQ